jgi:hypothetical protein
MSEPSSPTDRTKRRWERLFLWVFGAFLAVALLKFGNPVVLEGYVAAPTTGWELIFSAWPLGWSFAGLALAALAAVPVWRWRPLPSRWLVVLPLVWLGWQLLSATQTMEPRLTDPTVRHFGGCVACYYIGLFALSRVRHSEPFWGLLAAGFALVLWVGVDQHYGGLEQTRRMVEQMKSEGYPAEWRTRIESSEFQQKIASDRIFSTLVYPNALAGAVLLLLPVTLIKVWRGSSRLASWARGTLVGVLGWAGLACMYWSKSKAGWLILMAAALAVFLRMPAGRRLKLVVVIILLGAGLAAFGVRYSGYFARGATSAMARLDYWRVAWQVMRQEPFFGSGPGTFVIRYRALKPPDAEMTRLAHNDYLQQGSDSGWLGFVAYMAFVGAALWPLYRDRCFREMDPTRFSVWLGVAAFAIQSFVEFGLYIPALAYPFFTFLGWRSGGVVEPEPGFP